MGLRTSSWALFVVVLVGCTSGESDGDTAEDGGVSGASGNNSGAGGNNSGAGGSGSGGTVSNDPVGLGDLGECGGSCQADAVAGLAAMREGDFAAAFDAYKCADTPGAAFGAGLARMMMTVQSQAGTALLADLGLPAMKAKVLLGPGSVMSQMGERWNGEGHVEISGDATLSAELLVRNEFYAEDESGGGSGYVDLSLDAIDMTGDAEIEVDVYRYGPRAELTAGVFDFSVDCATGTVAAAPMSPSLHISLRNGASHYYCSVPSTVPTGAGCDSTPGSMEVGAPGLSIGDPATYMLQNVPMTCEIDEDDVSGPPLTLRVTGSFSATTVDDSDDFESLHPIFNADWLAAVPAESNVRDALGHVHALAAEIAQASCYFEKAAEGTGAVYTLPGELYGQHDADVSAGDAKLLSAATLLVLGAAQLAVAYEVDMPLNALLCDEIYPDCVDDGTCPEPEPVCAQDSEIVSLFNEGFARVFHADQLAAGEDLLRESAARVLDGIDMLDGSSLLVRNERSSQFIAQAREIAVAAQRSLEDETVEVPYLEPVLMLNLARLFGTPPSREGISADPLLYAEVCDPSFPEECDSEVAMNTEFWNEFFAGSATTSDWDQSPDLSIDEDALEALLRGLQRAGIVIDL